jgi:iron(III) transport system substrate-binding protein
MLKKKYFKILIVVLVGVMLLSCVSCGKKTEEQEPGEITEKGVFIGSEFIIDQETYEAAVKEGKVLVYTAHSLEHEAEMARAFKARFPGIDVEITRAGGATLHEKMLTEEAANVLKADVYINSDINYIHEFYEKGWTREHIPASDELYPEGSKVTGHWYPTGASAIIMAYHTELVSAEDAPKDWADLGDPKWKDKLGGQRLGGGAMWSMLSFLRSQLGTEVLEAWGNNNPIMHTSGAGLATALVAGEFLVTPMGLFAGYPAKYGQGAPIELVYPESGFPLYIPGIALVTFGENPNAAKLFMNWYLSIEGQTRLSNLRGQYSLRDDVVPAPYLTPLSELNYWIPDPEIFFNPEVRNQWISEANKAFGWE